MWLEFDLILRDGLRALKVFFGTDRLLPGKARVPCLFEQVV
jgi:hypothetical protein